MKMNNKIIHLLEVEYSSGESVCIAPVKQAKVFFPMSLNKEDEHLLLCTLKVWLHVSPFTNAYTTECVHEQMNALITVAIMQ